jgi:hypothetical protein
MKANHSNWGREETIAVKALKLYKSPVKRNDAAAHSLLKIAEV